jgi:hypothetical protein
LLAICHKSELFAVLKNVYGVVIVDLSRLGGCLMPEMVFHFDNLLSLVMQMCRTRRHQSEEVAKSFQEFRDRVRSPTLTVTD